MWLYVDERGRVLATSENDMTGNTGWVFIADAGISGDVLNSDGIPIWEISEGAVYPRDPADVDADTPKPEEPAEILSNEDVAEIMADHEYRICLMELGVNEEELA